MIGKLKRFFTKKARRGFTLIELAIVMVVLGIIMGIVFYNLKDSVSVVDSAKAMKVKGQAVSLPMDIEKFREAGGQLNTGDNLSAMAEPIPGSDWKPIPEEMLKDPWGAYYTVCQGQDGADRICSLGKDKSEGGEKENADFQLDDRTTWPDWIKKK